MKPRLVLVCRPIGASLFLKKGIAMLDATELTETFARDGFISPIRVMSEVQAAADRARLEEAEAMASKWEDGHSLFREYANIGLDFVGRIVADPAVTDPVAALLGEELLILGCSFFIKEPKTTAYVSWHQDLHYWGLEADDEIRDHGLDCPVARNPGKRMHALCAGIALGNCRAP